MGLFGFRTKSLYFFYLSAREDFPQGLTMRVRFFFLFSPLPLFSLIYCYIYYAYLCWQIFKMTAGAKYE